MKWFIKFDDAHEGAFIDANSEAEAIEKANELAKLPPEKQPAIQEVTANATD